MRRLLLPLPLLLFVCSGVHGQVTHAKGSLAGPTTVSRLPVSGNSNLLWDVRDGASATDCTSGGGSTRVVCKWNGSAYAAVGGTAGDTVGPASSTTTGLARYDDTTGKRLRNSLTTLSDAGVFTFISNKRQTFVPGAQQSGFNVGSVSTDPSIPINGDIWYNTGSFQMKAQINGSVVVLGAGITNSAGVNVLMKSDGTNAVGSRITDDATDIVINSGGGSTTIGDAFSIGNAVTLKIDVAAGNVTVDTGGVGALVIASNTNIVSGTAGGSAVGDLTRPFGAFYVGLAANTTTRISSAATGNQAAVFPDATGTVQLVGAANTGAILTCLSNNTVLSTATGQVFTSPGNDGTPLTVTSEGAVGWVVTRAGTVRNLYVRTGTTAKVNTPATSIVVRKNGVDTTLTIAAMTQTATTSSSDTTHSFTVVAGDVVTVSLTTTGVAGVSTSIASITFEID